MNNYLELKITKDGKIYFRREHKENYRLFLEKLMKRILKNEPEKYNRIKVFLNEANNRDLILGKEILCG